jgi:hypothetical protein
MRSFAAAHCCHILMQDIIDVNLYCIIFQEYDQACASARDGPINANFRDIHVYSGLWGGSGPQS